ncbi:MAG: hypothetical protein V4584_05115 [Verrucomicrobiota bacterium]
MKNTIFIIWSGAAAFASGGPKTEPAPQMRDAATHEQISQLYRQASAEDPFKTLKTLKASEGPDPSKVNQPEDLISQSDIICFNGMATLVPKKAILQIPKNLADRLKFKPGTKIESWADFYALNRGWITTVEVTRLQAEGNSPIAEKTQKEMVRCGNLIVATLQGGPISVLPQKAPAQSLTQVSKP